MFILEFVFEIFSFGHTLSSGMFGCSFMIALFIFMCIEPWLSSKGAFIKILIYSLLAIICLIVFVHSRLTRKVLVLCNNRFYLLQSNQSKCREIEKIIFKEKGFEIEFVDKQLENMVISQDDLDDFNNMTYDKFKKRIMESVIIPYDHSYFENEQR